MFLLRRFAGKVTGDYVGARWTFINELTDTQAATETETNTLSLRAIQSPAVHTSFGY